MDSVTQAFLGALTFAAVKDKDIGKKALLYGAIAGTIPDLDVLLAPFFNDVAFISVHRSFSHSILFALLFGGILGEIFHRIYHKNQARISWFLAFFFAVFTHSLLDWCTTYGIKFLSPFFGHIFSTNTIHVFEPIYSCILLIGFLVLLIKNRNFKYRFAVVISTLVLSSLYIFWTYTSKQIAAKNFLINLEQQEINTSELMVSPTPLNSFLWHGIAKTEKGYYFGTYSLFDKRPTIDFHFEASQTEILEVLDAHKQIQHYIDYTMNYPLIKEDSNGEIQIYAVKFGPVNYFGKPEFVFPLCFNTYGNTIENIRIDKTPISKGPIKNYKNLLRRIKGI